MPKNKKEIKYPKKLFKGNIVWGVTSGGHVAHIIDVQDPSNEDYTIIYGSEKKFTDKDLDNFNKFGDDYAQKHDYKRVDYADTFVNKSDNKTAELFFRIAKTCNEAYAKTSCDLYRDFLLAAKAYVTASGRSNQQKALLFFNQMAERILTTAQNNPEEIGEIKQGELQHVQNLYNEVKVLSDGGLQVDENYTYDINTIQEPSNTVIGAFGKWTPTDEKLFSHRVSPNDVKQGVGVEDCYVLAPLAQMAAFNPRLIEEAMRDNGDGTVTVRFFHPAGSKNKQPVFYTVKKTENKLCGYANIYASSSLWVKMVEKAYIKYLSEHPVDGRRSNSFSDINRGDSSQFLGAFFEGKNYSGYNGSFGYSRFANGELYDFNNDGSPKFNSPEYLDREELLYNTFKEALEAREVVAVGSSGRMLDRDSKKLKLREEYVKSKGIRTGHMYGVMGVFEKDGKKFVQLRDPYATFRAAYNDAGELVDDSNEITATLRAGTGTMGTFNLELRDFFRTFDTIGAMEEDRIRKYDQELENMPDYNGLTAVKKNEAAEAEEQLIEEPAGDILYETLKTNSGYLQVKDKINYLADDLAQTSMFFSFKNSDEFVKMRDKLNEVRKNMNAKRFYTEKDCRQLADEMKDLAKLAKAYADVKCEKVEETVRNKKEPSLRAVHRLASAVTLMCLVDDPEGPVARTEHGYAEGILILQSDLNALQAGIKDDPSKADLNRHIINASEKLNSYINKHPEIKEQQKNAKQLNPKDAAIKSAEKPVIEEKANVKEEKQAAIEDDWLNLD